MRIWIATGGTGGHVFPAMAVAAELAKGGHKITISTDGRVMNMVKRNKPARAGVCFVWASGVGAKSKLKQMWALFKIGLSSVALVLRFMFFRPDRVVAFGGYASVSAVFAAHLWKVPTLLHEQNGAVGRANKFTMRWVKTLMTSFPKVEGLPNPKTLKVVYTGLPVRPEIAAAAGSPLPLESKILVTGGSLGAQILDEVVPAALSAMKNKKIFVMHQTRPENVKRLQKFYADNKIRANVLSFINDMASAIVSSDLVIGRSGASTVVELQTIGRPAIFVPLAINPDQAANAENFVANGGGFAVSQDKFIAKWLTSTLTDLFDNQPRLIKMAEKALVPNNAVQLIVNEITRY
ncbi:MAG: UDP-N-acetylglucosamine--N-acetylmuramyl-(pentapeptide) pyrophosphoryl-undecaprenol N-acetylglucosamine transferase [Rickettsiales bacterium]|jgi:UDP-N-acetylglucosamine--N-acetylmuramyl-(pentapeptide) pyrophosphoryl-undecaprenol N-acetylglucosamine transferase|nr:UDP-N-acetylglucosamine--N-acetylmuramyl-(pentapeptide) pyrophosphoryl-undecaprenol N-acetylglucosamine transferase [Rickettsiales bacterium]